MIALLVSHESGGVTASADDRHVSILEKKHITTKLDVAAYLGARSAGAESALQTLLIVRPEEQQGASSC